MRLHATPEAAWTVERLAQEVNVSRATLARRFTDQVGESPIGYLARWRLDLAAGLLRETELPVGVVARRVGYTSEYAFSRAFRKCRGHPPGRYRRTMRATVTPPATRATTGTTRPPADASTAAR